MVYGEKVTERNGRRFSEDGREFPTIDSQLSNPRKLIKVHEHYKLLKGIRLTFSPICGIIATNINRNLEEVAYEIGRFWIVC